MSLKEELAKLEKEEQLTEVEDRLNGIQESIYGLYRRIGIIVEYIDKTEKEVNTKEAVKAMGELQEAVNEKERINSAYDKGFEKGVNYTMKRVREMREASESLKKESQTASKEATEEVKEKDKIGLGLGRATGDV